MHTSLIAFPSFANAFESTQVGAHFPTESESIVLVASVIGPLISSGDFTSTTYILPRDGDDRDWHHIRRSIDGTPFIVTPSRHFSRIYTASPNLNTVSGNAIQVIIGVCESRQRFHVIGCAVGYALYYFLRRRISFVNFCEFLRHRTWVSYHRVCN